MKSISVLLIATILFASCVKSGSGSQSCTDVSPIAEEGQMISFCEANGINYTRDSSGIYYEIMDPGTGMHPTLYSIITTTYVGKYLSGVTFDSSLAPYTSELGSLIRGWQIGLPKIGEGGRIKMVIPSSLCYGCYGVPLSGLPPNTILYFDVQLLDVKQ